MSRKITADICIIGAGSGGLSVAAGAAQLGRKTVLIEKGEMGGDCLNTGCVPSKALLAAAKRAQSVRTASEFGITAQEPSIDYAAVMKHVRGVIETIAPIDSQERFEGLGVTVLRDAAEFISERTVKAGDFTVHAKHFVIATGSTPYAPPIEGLAETPYFTNENLFENNEAPKRLAIIGGGPIGVEMAQAHRRLGADVIVFEGQRILGNDDPELVDVVRRRLIDEGVELHEDAAVQSVKSDGAAIIVTANGRSYTVSHVLVAVGRRPTVDGLGLDVAGVKFDKGGIKVDNRLRTSNKRIYAIGDVAGGRQFTHVAGYHASIVIRNILFKMPSKNGEALAPHVTYSDPELAHVGLTENAAKKKHSNVTVARWSFDENDRAQAERETEGFVKVVAGKGGRILGASIVGTDAGDLIQPWALAMSNDLKISAFTKMIAPYPTRGEAGKRAAGAWYTPALFSDRTRKLISLLSVFD